MFANRRSKTEKKNKEISLFLRKTRVEAKKFITNCLKTLDFVSLTLPSTRIMSFVILVNETRLQKDNKNLNKNAKLKIVFFFENNCFQSYESRQLFTQIRIWLHLFVHKRPMRPLFI